MQARTLPPRGNPRPAEPPSRRYGWGAPLVFAVLTGATCGGPPRPRPEPPVHAVSQPKSVPPLRETAATAHRRIGAAVMSRHLENPALRKVLATHFDSLTAENEMKWQTTEPRPGEFSLAAGDRLVAFAADHGMRVRGHTLVWHFQLARWVADLRGEALREAMRRHIRTLVGHWRGRIGQWDVVNEALADGRDRLRPSPFLELGETYLDEAFREAHAADPDAQLFYNDYEIEGGPGQPKSDAAYRLCARLLAAGVPIHGIGMQMHVDPRAWPSPAQIQRNVERFAALGLVVEFTELDVPVGQIPGTAEEKQQRQRALAHDLVAACVRVDRCTGVTLWGISDATSWLDSPRWSTLRGRGPHLPLAFDEDLEPKPMFFGILDALAGR
jgi:endo-1,4-beta-xylanase